MTQTNPVARVVGYVLGPPIEWVGRRVERRARRAAPDLPELPAWAVPVVVVGGMVVAVLVEAVGETATRSERERAEPEPKATAERGTTTASDDASEVEDALETLEVAPPPLPEPEDVRAAYRARVKETHPDQGGEAERFIEVREAWLTVSERQELSDDSLDGEVTQKS